MKYLEMCNKIIKDEKKVCLIRNGAFYVAVGNQAYFLSYKFGFKRICFSDGVCKIGLPLGSLTQLVFKLQTNDISHCVYEYSDSDNVNGDALKYDNSYSSGDKEYIKVWQYISNNLDALAFDECICDVKTCKYKRAVVVKEIATLNKRIIELKETIKVLDDAKNIDDTIYIDGYIV